MAFCNYDMKHIWSALIIGTAAFAMAAGPENPVSPYPGGSPFPPGKEPKLTHVARAYWSTLNGLTTIVKVSAAGDRPTQVELHMLADGELRGVHGSISPDCNWTTRIVPDKTKKQGYPAYWTGEGHGELIVRVYGHKATDIDQPPHVEVPYLSGEKVIARTTVESVAITEKPK
jgi:hypothetical protein